MPTVWDQNPRHIKTVVTIGASDVTSLIVGQVTITREGGNPLPTCDFTLFTPRMAYYASGSLSTAPQTVIVEVTCSAPGYSPETVELFRGITEAPSNTGPFIPQGTVHAVGILSRALDNPGCLYTTAFPEVTRLDLLQTFAEGALVPVTIDGALVTSGTVTKPQDHKGVTILDVAKRWGLYDGWEMRENAGEIQLIPFADIASPGVTTIWDFLPSNYYSCAELPPSRPVTKWVLSGNFTHIAPDDVPGTPTVDVVDVPDDVGTGHTKTTTTRLDGVIQQLKTERYEDYTPLGDVAQTPLTDTVVKRETIDFTYALNGDGLPTAQLTDKVTVREAWYSPFAAVGTGAPEWTYTDTPATFHHEQTETLQEVERLVEAYTYDAIGAYLTAASLERHAWIAWPVETSPDGAYTDPGTLWPDGTTRTDAYEVYGIVETTSAAIQWKPAGGLVQPPYSNGYANSNFYSQFRLKYTYADRYRCNPGSNWSPTSPRIAEVTEETLREDADGTHYERSLATWKIRPWYDAGSGGFLFEALSQAPRVTTVDGPIPWPVSACPSARQYSMVQAKATFEAIGFFDPKVQSEENEVFENSAEFERYARWMMKKGFADRITVSHPGQPLEVIRELDPVTVSDATARNINYKPSWIERIKFILEPANGRFDQETQCAIDPYIVLVSICQ